MKYFTMKLAKKASVAAAAALVSLASLTASAGILDLDFTSDGTGKAAGFGGGPVVGTAPGYTAFVVAELGPGAVAVTTNPTVTENGVTFTINGSINAWPGNNGSTDLLQGDYLFLGNSDGALGVTPRPMPWTISGLTPNAQYAITHIHGTNGGAGRSLLVEAPGSTSLTVTGAAGSQFGNFFATANASGVITGTWTGLGGEGNLAALSLNRVTIPGDANSDGLVNGADFDIISANLFTPQLTGDNGDLNLDRQVNFADFRIWKDAVSSTAANGVVPEPASLSLVVVSLFAAGVVRRRRGV